jgi:hypothetical protein
MGCRLGRKILSVLVFVLMSQGCSPVVYPKRPEGPGVTFKASTVAVQRAAIHALVVNGFKVSKETPTYVEGKRPRLVGVFVGSGGETAGVWIDALDSTTSIVRVHTGKAGTEFVGQQNWDSEIIIETTKALKREQ